MGGGRGLVAGGALRRLRQHEIANDQHSSGEDKPNRPSHNVHGPHADESNADRRRYRPAKPLEFHVTDRDAIGSEYAPNDSERDQSGTNRGWPTTYWLRTALDPDTTADSEDQGQCSSRNGRPGARWDHGNAK